MIADAPAPMVKHEATAERLGYTVPELARATGLSVQTFRRMIAAKKLTAVRIGWQFVIPAPVVREMFPNAKL